MQAVLRLAACGLLLVRDTLAREIQLYVRRANISVAAVPTIV